MATRKRGTRPPKHEVSPIFYIPDGVEDIVVSQEVLDEFLEDFDDEDEPEEPKGDGGGSGKPGKGGIVRIHNQKLRTRKDGSQVVDVVVVIEKEALADGYKFRVTPMDSGKSTVHKLDEDGNII